jgi:hypothetical protein
MSERVEEAEEHMAVHHQQDTSNKKATRRMRRGGDQLNSLDPDP